MSVVAFCTGCGQRQDVPAGYSKSKFRCAECGVIFELPPDIRELARNAPAEEEKRAPAAPVRKKPRVKQTEADAAADMLFTPEKVPAKPAAAPPPVATPPKRTPKPPPVRQPEVEDDDDIAPVGETELEPTIIDDEGPEREVLIEGTEEDDRNPYRVTGDVKKQRCPECGKSIDYREQFCVHCGFNLKTGEKAKRNFQPINRVWENGWPFQKRLTAFFVCQAVNLALLVGLWIAAGFEISIVTLIIQVALQAFLLGTFDTLKLTRNSKGKVTITKTWRYAFVPLKPQTIRWRDHEGLVIVQSHESQEFDIFNWGIAIILLGYGCVPGILFWYYVIRPDKWDVALALAHGTADVSLYHGMNEARAREIHAVVSDATGLKDNRI
ncbi:MAG TPA: zinc ribbon domain-containing protein [Gemmataceae bacterium]|jgi:predicted RNA-binding Zn-ribbon protein involved in translation (DUF1610 family)|nr:zinc ribbon domain-containing protein [Gemmataceae bacterium]